MEKARPLREYVCFGDRKVKHRGGGWKINHGLRYNPYQIHEDVALTGRVAFVYSDSVQHDVRDRRKVLLGDANLLYVSDEKKRAENMMSRNTATVNMLGDGDKDRAMDESPDY